MPKRRASRSAGAAPIATPTSTAFPTANFPTLSPSQYVSRTADFLAYCRCIRVLKNYENDNTLSYLGRLPDYALAEVHAMLPKARGNAFLPKSLREWAQGTTFIDEQEADFAAELRAIPAELYKQEPDASQDIPVSQYLRFLLPAYDKIRARTQFGKYELSAADGRASIDGLIEGFGTDQFSRSADLMTDPRVIFRRDRELRLCKLIDVNHGVPDTLPSHKTTVDCTILLCPSKAQSTDIMANLARLPGAAGAELRWQENGEAKFSTMLLSATHDSETKKGADRIVYSLATNQRHRQALGLPPSVQYGLACEEERTHVIASILDAGGEMINMVKVAVIQHTSLVDLLRFCHFLNAIRRRGHEEMVDVMERFAQPLAIPTTSYWRQPERGPSAHGQDADAGPRKKARHLPPQRPSRAIAAPKPSPPATGSRRSPHHKTRAPPWDHHVQYLGPALFILFSNLDSGRLKLTPEEEENYQRVLAQRDELGPREGTSYRHAEHPVRGWIEELRAHGVPDTTMDQT